MPNIFVYFSQYQEVNSHRGPKPNLKHKSNLLGMQYKYLKLQLYVQLNKSEQLYVQIRP